MSVKNTSFEYDLPDDIRQMVTKDFCETLFTQLAERYPFLKEKSEPCEADLAYLEQSGGWSAAFESTCDSICPSLRDYWCTLDKQDSELFCNEINSIIADLGIVAHGGWDD